MSAATSNQRAARLPQARLSQARLSQKKMKQGLLVALLNQKFGNMTSAHVR
jgi:hypothetical protein